MRRWMTTTACLGISATLGCTLAFFTPTSPVFGVSLVVDDASNRTARVPAAQDALARPDDTTHGTDTLADLSRANPGVTASYATDGRIARLYGKPFGGGATPQAAAQRFVDRYAGLWEVQPEDLVPIGPFADGQHITPMMLDDQTQMYRFTGVHYTQQRDGVPVFRGRLTLLARNEPGHPLVLASADLRPMGGEVDLSHTHRELDTLRLQDVATDRFASPCQVSDASYVIWAGVDDQFVQPTPGVQYTAQYHGPDGPAKWLIIDDARTGRELYRENLILNADVTGTVSAMSTSEIGAAPCSAMVEKPLAYARVLIPDGQAFADENGVYVMPNLPPGETIRLTSGLEGKYFRVMSHTGGDSEISSEVTPPTELNFLHDPTGLPDPELMRAEIDAYIHANIVRDFALDVVPLYPVVSAQLAFEVNVNINNNCNATYSGDAINFYTSGGGCNNTAMDTIVYHEYGHHLVSSGGSGQGQYGEGMADCVALLITDDPVLGRGFSNCAFGIRTANNTMQYPCAGEIHACGTLISGCVWSLRNQLVSTEPDDWSEILSDLTLNSILLHTGSFITPQITIDFLTLDDDNGNIFDGTPHFDEIMTAFMDEHGMDPQLPMLTFNFPDGMPEQIHPVVGETLIVEVLPDNGIPMPGTGVMHFDDGGGFVSTSMPQLEPNVYQVVLPALACTENAQLFFTAQANLAYTQQFPAEGAAHPLRVYGATSSTTRLADDFEIDNGWSVESTLLLTGGEWDRGIPVGGGVRGDPPTDADGSGQCYCTDRLGGNTDVDSGATTLTSPTFDASAANVMAYWRWYSNSGGAAPEQDVFIVEISDDDGDTWQLLEQVGPSGPDVHGGWIRKQFRFADVPDFVRNDQFRIRFIASDTDPQSLVEAAVDGFQLLDLQCGPLLAGDFNGDGLVDLEDLLLIIAGWGPCQPAAPCGRDSDGDGIVGLTELLEVISNWGI